MLPAAPPGGVSPLVPAIPVAGSAMPPYEPVLLALPPTAPPASVVRTLRAEGVAANPVSDGIAVPDAVRARDPALLVLDVDLPGPHTNPSCWRCHPRPRQPPSCAP